jgi:hypothetical protein
MFVRWCAGNSEDELLASVPVAVDAAEWEPEVVWEVPGAVLLFDAAWPGSSGSERVRVGLQRGRYAVRAARVQPGAETWLGLVQLRLLAPR